MKQLLAFALIAAACAGDAPHPALHLVGGSLLRMSVPVQSIGLSGLTRDDRGRLWAVPEEDRKMIVFGRAMLPRDIELRGVADGLELESITFLGNNEFAIGTESEQHRERGDSILIVRVDGDEAHVIRELPVDLERSENKGIEGLCHASGVLIAAS